MTVDGAHDAQLTTARAVRPPPWQAVVLEVVASLAATGSVVLIFLNHVGAHLTFFGGPVRIQQEQVHTYWVLVGVLLVAVVLSFSAAGWRRARGAFAWHLVVALAGVLVAVSFPVTQAGLVDERPEPVLPERVDRPGSPVCHSGGDSRECVGG